MEMKLCSVGGCNNPVNTRGYCSAHYGRWKRHGDPLAGRKFDERHGMTNTRIYRCWLHIKQRCFNPECVNYKNYGGRGITMCDKWANSFMAFYEDMGEPPTLDHSIERSDVNGNYEPTNCYWADGNTQIANQRVRNTNTSGFVGVTKSANRWQARVCWQGTNHYIGSFKTPEEAATWRDAYVIANGWPHTLNCSVGA